MRPLELSAGERLAVSRRAAGMSQAEAADCYGVPVHRWRAWENDKLAGAPVVPADVTRGAWCYIRRRREDWTLRDLSDRTKLGVTWLHQAEHDTVDPAPLVAWWEDLDTFG